MTLFIEASNIKAGGGLTHLIELLQHIEITSSVFEQVMVAAPDASLEKLPHTEWLQKYSHPWLNGNYWQLWKWKKNVLPKLTKEEDIQVFVPGTGSVKKKPYVTMCRNLLPIDTKEHNRFFPSLTWLRYRVLRKQHFKAYRKAAGVIFLNNYCFEALPKDIQKGIQSKAVIPHGIHQRFFQTRPSYERGETFKLVYVSILNLYKHQWKVAEAVYQLRKEGYAIELTLIGPAQQQALKKLQAVMAEYNDKEGVVWKGKVPYEQLHQIYDEIDAAVYASTCETFGMTLLEAMAASLPIACSNKSSMPEMLQDAGLYFDPEDIGSIKAAIGQLYDNQPLRKELGQRAHQYAKQYTWEKCAEDTMAYLETSLRGRR